MARQHAHRGSERERTAFPKRGRRGLAKTPCRCTAAAAAGSRTTYLGHASNGDIQRLQDIYALGPKVSFFLEVFYCLQDSIGKPPITFSSHLRRLCGG